MSQVVLVCGAAGQLGVELSLTSPDDVTLHACDRRSLDITDASAVAQAIDDSGARAVINAAAYTAVDKAESEQAAAQAINAQGPDNLARACAARGLRLIHVSTDFVFDGKQGRPYRPDDATHPLGVYGQTKLDGERAVLGSGADAVVLRTGWVYSRHGGNFVKTMLRLMAEREHITVVEDQIGTPTWARSLAQTCWSLLTQPQALGTLHWSDAGACSWYDFALAIREEAQALGLLQRAAEVTPIPAVNYPTPAARPSFSVLDKSATREFVGHAGEHWRHQLRAMLADMKDNEESL